MKLGKVEKKVLEAMLQWHRKGLNWLTLEQTALIQDDFGCSVYLVDRHKKGIYKGGSLDWHDWYGHKERLERLIQKGFIRKCVKSHNTFYALTGKAIEFLTR